jgi:hypothetical protein
MRLMNSSAFASSAARTICSSVASGRPKAMLSGHGAAQQHRFLQHKSDLSAQTVQLEVADVDAVDADAPGVGISEARHHAQYG